MIFLFANSLTIFRFVLGLAFPFFPAGPRVWVIMAAGISDLFDGMLSRRFHATSDFGKLFDPIADKVFIVAVVATLLFDGTLSLPDVLLVCLRDIVVLSLVGWGWSRGHASRWQEKFGPRWSGKLATAAQFVFVLVVAWDASLLRCLLVPTAVISGLAAIDYSLLYRRATQSNAPDAASGAA